MKPHWGGNAWTAVAKGSDPGRPGQTSASGPYFPIGEGDGVGRGHPHLLRPLALHLAHGHCSVSMSSGWDTILHLSGSLS